MLNINLFGGPGTGKSTTAYGLMYSLKDNGKKAEFIPEYAKELTYGEEWTKLSDQLLLLGEQHHRLFRLSGKVNYVVHDSPFIMGLAYTTEYTTVLKEHFENLVVELYNSYNNLNVFLERDLASHPYQEYGRTQSLEEAIDKDNEIKALLDKHYIPYVTVSINGAVDSIKLLIDGAKV